MAIDSKIQAIPKYALPQEITPRRQQNVKLKTPDTPSWHECQLYELNVHQVTPAKQVFGKYNSKECYGVLEKVPFNTVSQNMTILEDNLYSNESLQEFAELCDWFYFHQRKESIDKKCIKGWGIVSMPATNEKGYYQNSFTGYAGVLVSNKKTGQLVFINSGTNDFFDWLTNFGLIAGIPGQLKDAQNFLDLIHQSYPYRNLVIIGHSLGGAAAQVTKVAAVLTLKRKNDVAITFNAAGGYTVASQIKGFYDYPEDNWKITNYKNNDPVVPNILPQTGEVLYIGKAPREGNFINSFYKFHTIDCFKEADYQEKKHPNALSIKNHQEAYKAVCIAPEKLFPLQTVLFLLIARLSQKKQHS